MNNHTYTRKYTRACIQTHIQTEIMIILAFYTLLTRHSDSGSPFRNCALGIAQFRNRTLNLEIAHAQFRNWSYSGTGRNKCDLTRL